MFGNSQRIPEEGLVDRIRSLFMYLLDNSNLFSTVLVFLIIVVLFGTPAALGWITNTGTVGFFFFLIIFVICGLINPMRYQGQSRHWPSTEGVVEESWITLRASEDSPSYSPHVQYRYLIGDKVYRNSFIDTPGIGDSEILSKTAAEQKVAPYPEGTQVTVYYDPKRPWFSVLEAGKVNYWYWIPVIILLPFLAWSGYYIYTEWPGFEPSRYRALWEEVTSKLPK